MSGKKKLLIVLLLTVVLAVAGGFGWTLMNYHVVGTQLYPKDLTSLDLRGKNISISHYESLTEKFPDITIRWDVPFQGGRLADDTTQVKISQLSMDDVQVLDYLPKLKKVNAIACRDYDALLALKERRPKLTVWYDVTIGGTAFQQDCRRIQVDSITPEELELLQYLTKLEEVAVIGGGNGEHFGLLQEYCQEQDLEFYIHAGGVDLNQELEEIILEEPSEEDLEILAFFPNMKRLHMVKPQAEPETVLQLRRDYPEAEITWEVALGELTFADDVEEVDLSSESIADLDEVERVMAYLPEAELLVMGLCGNDNPSWGNRKAKGLGLCPIENEEMAAFRDHVREDYKVAWTVRLGPNIALRTDKDNFMPNHFGVGILTDEYAYNLRYCEDMVCLDVGHMTLTDISFVEFMPKLKYLILAWTEVQYIEPIRTCKNLIFLELDNSCIRDYSPLVDCTALEDLNIGKTYCDITPILEMTWLKNLYMIFGSQRSAYLASQALPDTRVAFRGNATVGAGWRRLPNYYDMRDCLGMYYMN